MVGEEKKGAKRIEGVEGQKAVDGPSLGCLASELRIYSWLSRGIYFTSQKTAGFNYIQKVLID